ncbi:hypothetical protein KI387_022664 [Taxus chinensis]|uniref:Endoglucanase n=1 Tax=Taxus chinensis TaxID=29808 RepID=A0AA38G0J9_TAXCH|nr:hypothetical protein KI387_022664 [Taxus chinensis]
MKKKMMMFQRIQKFVFLMLLVAPPSTLSSRPVQEIYRDALSKSILFFEGQRSGKLPRNQRLNWRKDSALRDGSQQNVDLMGGYYDAGDNVKFGFPMAYTTTMLAWSVLEFGGFMGSELQKAMSAIRWGTDYLLKATAYPDVIYVQVGDPSGDHRCWERPEDMDTPRTVYKITKDMPGTEVAAEIAAAMAASSIVFKRSDPGYSQQLLNRATSILTKFNKNVHQVFEFADKYRGSYTNSVPGACPFYCSNNGYDDELLWAAAWLQRATGAVTYMNYILSNFLPYGGNTDVNEFGWDNKHAGVSVLLSQEFLLGKMPSMHAFKENADKFICWFLPETPNSHVQFTPGGLISKTTGSNMQAVTAISFLLVTYASYLGQASASCENVQVTPGRLQSLAKRQVDYILGNNPERISYMVGFGSNYPKEIHHRGSSLPSITQYPRHIACSEGYNNYFNSRGPNPNVLVGAVVGGPDQNDHYTDTRLRAQQTEPATYINAPLVGVLAFFTSHPY